MRFRHDLILDRPRCAGAAFGLIADHSRLRERQPDAPLPRVVTDKKGAVGHVVEFGEGARAVRVETVSVGPGLAVAFVYSTGMLMEWRVRDFQDRGAIVTLLADVPELEPGERAEEFRAGLLADLQAIKRIVENETR